MSANQSCSEETLRTIFTEFETIVRREEIHRQGSRQLTGKQLLLKLQDVIKTHIDIDMYRYYQDETDYFSGNESE